MIECHGVVTADLEFWNEGQLRNRTFRSMEHML